MSKLSSPSQPKLRTTERARTYIYHDDANPGPAPRAGKSWRICPVVRPPSTMLTIVVTGVRRSRMIGIPTRGSTWMRSNAFSESTTATSGAPQTTRRRHFSSAGQPNVAGAKDSDGDRQFPVRDRATGRSTRPRRRSGLRRSSGERAIQNEQGAGCCGRELRSATLAPVPAAAGHTAVIAPDHLPGSGRSTATAPLAMVSNGSEPVARPSRGGPT